MPAQQKVNACFTAYQNLYAPVDWNHGSPLRRVLRYFAYGLETCPETGNLHCQGFAIAWKKMSHRTFRETIQTHFPGAHVELMSGSLATNEHYCSKESALNEFGLPPTKSGEKHILVEYKHRLDNGEHPLEVAEDDKLFGTYCQYRGGIEKYHSHMVSKRLKATPANFAPEVYYCYGPPGSGKTRWVHERESAIYSVPAGDKFKWKDGYHGQEAVLFDNVQLDNIASTQFLMEIDRYYIQVPIKGGFVGWRPKRIYITSVCSIRNLATAFTHQDEFIRRVTNEMQFPQPP